jgi:hypothetical protein
VRAELRLLLKRQRQLALSINIAAFIKSVSRRVKLLILGIESLLLKFSPMKKNLKKSME